MTQNINGPCHVVTCHHIQLLQYGVGKLRHAVLAVLILLHRCEARPHGLQELVKVTLAAPLGQ